MEPVPRVLAVVDRCEFDGTFLRSTRIYRTCVCIVCMRVGTCMYIYVFVYVCMQIWLILSKVHVHWPLLYMCCVYACTYMYVCMLVCKYLLTYIYVYEFNRTSSRSMQTYRSGVCCVCVGTCMYVRWWVYIYSYMCSMRIQLTLRVVHAILALLYMYVMHACMYVCMYVCIYMYLYVNYSCMYVCVFECMYECTWVCGCLYIHTEVYTCV